MLCHSSCVYFIVFWVLFEAFLVKTWSTLVKPFLELIGHNCCWVDHVDLCVHTNLHPCCKCPNLFLSTDETSFEAGIKVQIHTQDEPPFIDQLGFGVAPGFQTFVSCQEQRVRLGENDTQKIQNISANYSREKS